MSILPYIEEQPLGDIYQFLPKDAEFHDPAFRYDSADRLNASPPMRNRQVISTRIATLTCPSDESQVNTTHAPGVAITYHNYVVNYGNTNHIGRDHLGKASPAYVQYLGGPFVGDDWNVPPQGVNKFSRITDGLSKTLLASETVQGRDGDLRGFTWWGWAAGFEGFFSPNASDPDLMQYPEACKFVTPNPPCSTQSTGNYFKAAARSWHRGGVNAVLCDGSVSFVVDDVDLAVWRAASTTKGAEVYQGLTP
jgi:prepilin-type processing-associated H-X9-DG protein